VVVNEEVEEKKEEKKEGKKKRKGKGKGKGEESEEEEEKEKEKKEETKKEEEKGKEKGKGKGKGKEKELKKEEEKEKEKITVTETSTEKIQNLHDWIKRRYPKIWQRDHYELTVVFVTTSFYRAMEIQFIFPGAPLVSKLRLVTHSEAVSSQAKKIAERTPNFLLGDARQILGLLQERTITLGLTPEKPQLWIFDLKATLESTEETQEHYSTLGNIMQFVSYGMNDGRVKIMVI